MDVNGAPVQHAFNGEALWTYNGKLIPQVGALPSVVTDEDLALVTWDFSSGAKAASGASRISGGATIGTTTAKGASRASALAAGGTINTTVRKGVAKSSSLSAGATINTTAGKSVAKSSSLSAGATINTTVRKGVARASALSAGATITTTGQKGATRTSALAAGATISTSGSGSATPKAVSVSSSLSGGATIATTAAADVVADAPHGLQPRPRSKSSRPVPSVGGIELVQVREPRKPDVASGPATAEWIGLHGSLLLTPAVPVGPTRADLAARRAADRRAWVLAHPPLVLDGARASTSTVGVAGMFSLTIQGVRDSSVAVTGVPGELWLLPGTQPDEDIPPVVLDILFGAY